MPRSVAIAGAWGYIGRKFLDAALSLGCTTYVMDPGKAPPDLAVDSLRRIETADAFYRLPVDLFHLALHPEERAPAERALVERADAESLAILDEKPMAPPEDPGRCAEIVALAAASPAVLLYDFPELYDPMTARILEFLERFRAVAITSISLQRSKDREDPAIPRNYKKMVPIQYQETVHCLAFVLFLLGSLRGGFEGALEEGLSISAASEPYCPPNPREYTTVVDGRCRWEITLGKLTVSGLTDFKRSARWSKRRLVEGIGDGRRFTIEAEYLEGHKALSLGGVDQGCDPNASSYESVLRTIGRWRAACSSSEIRQGLYPNPSFARLTYQLSSVLWRASHDRRQIRLASAKDLLAFDARFRASLLEPGT